MQWQHPCHLLARFVWDFLIMHITVAYYSSADWKVSRLIKNILTNCYFESDWRQCPTHSTCLTFWGRKSRKDLWKPHAGLVLLTALNCLTCVELLEALLRPALPSKVFLSLLGLIMLNNNDNNHKSAKSYLCAVRLSTPPSVWILLFNMHNCPASQYFYSLGNRSRELRFRETK